MMSKMINLNLNDGSKYSLRNHSESLQEIKEEFLALLSDVNRSEKLVWTMLTQVREGLQNFIKGPMLDLIEQAVIQTDQQSSSQQRFLAIKKKSHSHLCHRKQLALLLNFMEDEGYIYIYKTQLLKTFLNESDHNPPRFSKLWKSHIRHRLIALMLLKFEQLRKGSRTVFNVLDLWYKLFPEIPICDLVDDRYKNKKGVLSEKQSSRQAAYELAFLEKEFSQILKLEEKEGQKEDTISNEPNKSNQKGSIEGFQEEESNCELINQQMNLLSLSNVTAECNINISKSNHNYHQQQHEEVQELEDRLGSIQIEQENQQHSPLKQQRFLQTNFSAQNQNSFLQTPHRDNQSMIPLYDSTNLRLAYESGTDQKSVKCFSAVQAPSKHNHPSTTPFFPSLFIPPIIHRNPSHQIFETERNESSIGVNLFIPTQ